ncbi:hypothetical protein IA69_19215 [Massilia sp. JS1662]|nr:hypothetical protein [Massilia sp. JS1662]KGF80305.1 hypothetical protein IA69_19215 [Massilia sp. JS1662]
MLAIRFVTCVVCGDRIPPHVPGGATRPAGPYPSCTAAGCRMVVGRRAAMGDAAFAPYLARQAAQVRERRAAVADLQAQAQDRQRENAAAWSYLARRMGDAAHPDGGLRIALPSGPRRTRALAGQRRAGYRRRLADLVTQAHDAVEEVLAGDTESVASTLPGRLCGLCRGGCCTRGGDHAYLTAGTMRAYMRRHPGLSDAQVVERYVDSLPPASQAGSCINHTPAGCALPRDMRSATCNAYACPALAQLIDAQRGEVAPRVVLVVQRSKDKWTHAGKDVDDRMVGIASLTEEGARRFRLPAKHIATSGGIRHTDRCARD